MKIDLNFALENEYKPSVGAEYEIAPGVWGKMRPPTVGLQERVMELASKDGTPDLKVAREVLEGLKEFKDEDAISGMPSIVVTDFFTLVTRIGEKLRGLLEVSDQ